MKNYNVSYAAESSNGTRSVGSINVKAESSSEARAIAKDRIAMTHPGNKIYITGVR